MTTTIGHFLETRRVTSSSDSQRTISITCSAVVAVVSLGAVSSAIGVSFSTGMRFVVGVHLAIARLRTNSLPSVT